MSRMRNTKGASLKDFYDGFDPANMADIRTIAEWLEIHRPETVAALRTRRVVALVETARQEADEGLRNLWGHIAYQDENNWPSDWCIEDALKADPGLAESASPEWREATDLLRRARDALAQIEEARDTIARCLTAAGTGGAPDRE